MSKKFATNPKNKPAARPKAARNIPAPVAEIPCIAEDPSVKLLQSPATTPAEAPDAPAKEQHTMTLNFVRSKAARKDDRLVIFNFADGRPGSVQFLRTAFPKDSVPETITMDGDFASYTGKAPKIVETKEERKARLAALPKPTLAEKVAKAEERAAALRAKLAKVA